MFFTYGAANIYDELPDNLKPASADEAMIFSVESIFAEKPFGVHKFWPWLAPDAPEMKPLIESCPEILGILPPEKLSEPLWKDLVCSLNISRDKFDVATTISFDFREVCGAHEEATL